VVLVAREAGVSIKPGAQAPGSLVKNAISPRKRATAVKVASDARFAGLFSGFLLANLGLAPQALCLRPLRGLRLFGVIFRICKVFS
jgi:hypothetical protein